ncbi:HXK1_2 [Sanghuangporus weigelae]
MPASRRGSGSVTLPSGTTLAIHTRTSPTQLKSDISSIQTMADHLRKYEQLFTLTPQRMRMITQAFSEVLDNGLKKHNQVVPMTPTFVFGWPTGNEVRHKPARLSQGEGKFEIAQTKYRLTEEQKHDDGEKLFDFCAECLKTFIETNLSTVSEPGANVSLDTEEKDKKSIRVEQTESTGHTETLLQPGQQLSLGFTVSSTSYYPCQERIDHGSIEKLDLPINLTALINDTTGTLIASHYVNPRTKIAVIFGTGCNAAYMEKVSEITKIHDLGLDRSETGPYSEKGAIDSHLHEHLPRTKYDQIVDETSNKPGKQAFEKLISGRYLGEILRLVICELIDEGVLFLGQNTYKLEKPYCFDTAFLSLMESDPTDELLMIIGIFTHFFALETTLAERQFFRALARLVGRRAARLSACGIAAIVTKMGYLDEGCSVGADGSLYNKYPGFADRVHEGLVDIFGDKGRNIVTHHAEDGSGVGSAIIAVMTKARKEAGIFSHV